MINYREPSTFGARLSGTFIFLIILFALGMFESFLFSDTGGGTEAGIPALQVIWAAIYALVFAWSMLHLRSLGHLSRQMIILLLPPLLALLSALWAQDGGPVVRRTIALFFTYLIGAYISAKCDLRHQLKILCSAILISAILSYFVELAAPGWVPVVEAHPGSWNGVFPHKNMLARIMVLGVITFLCFEPRGRREKWVRLTGIACTLSLVMLSRSVTGYLSLMILSACYLILKHSSLRGAKLALVMTASVGMFLIACFAAVNYSDSFLGALGRDSSGTGRVILWKISLNSVAKQPFLGYGFRAFWHENNEALSARVLLPNHWDAPHAHNGYIETLLELGIVGLSLICLGLVLVFVESLGRYRTIKKREYLWPVMLVLFICVYNLTESAMMVENTLTWILLVASAARLCVERNDSHLTSLSVDFQVLLYDRPIPSVAYLRS